MAEKEQDNQKKRELQDKYNRLFEARKKSDPKWQKADIAIQQLGRLYNDTHRQEMEAHAGRKKLDNQIRRLRENLAALNKKMTGPNSEYAKLQASRSEKQAALGATRRQIEQRIRSSAAYKKAEEAQSAARKAMDDARKRIVEAKSGEVAKLDARSAKLHKEAQLIRNNALKSAGLLGRNPYPGRDVARLRDFQQSLKYHTRADWDYRTREEIDDKVPPKMKKWLQRVRGY